MLCYAEDVVSSLNHVGCTWIFIHGETMLKREVQSSGLPIALKNSHAHRYVELPTLQQFLYTFGN